jgi:hypothetical protein
MRHSSILVVSAVVVLGSVAAYAADVHEKDHADLTELRKFTQQAINTQQFETLRPHLAGDTLTVITVDGQKLGSLDEFATYWNNLFKDKKTGLDRIEVNPVADGPTEFLAPNVGISHGTSTDKYYFKNGDVKEMPGRWTAVVLKEGDAWKISRIIFSASIFDNPMVKDALKVIEQETQKAVAIAGVGGFLMGAIAGFLIGNRKKAAPSA